LTLNEFSFVEPTMKRGNQMRESSRRLPIEKANHRHRLLRPRCHWPRCRRTTQNTEKFPPPHARPQAQETAW